MDWIAPLLNVIVIALLVWTDYRLSRRVAVLEASEVFYDDALSTLAEQVALLETAAAPKTRAVKKPVAS